MLLLINIQFHLLLSSKLIKEADMKLIKSP